MKNLVSSATFQIFKNIKDQCHDLKWCINGQRLSASMDADQAVNDADMWPDPSDSAVITAISAADNAISKIFSFISGAISVIGVIDTLYFNY